MKNIEITTCFNCIFFDLVGMEVNTNYIPNKAEYDGFCRLYKLDNSILLNRFIFYDYDYIWEECPLKNTNITVKLARNDRKK